MPAFTDIAFTPEVLAKQVKYGSRQDMAALEEAGAEQALLPVFLGNLVSDQEFFYLATVGSNGWPYMQHKGGPAGFVKVLDAKTIAFADINGNEQYLSLGNISANPRVLAFFIDHQQGVRLKIWAEAELIEDDEQLAFELAMPGQDFVERAIKLHIKAWNVDCPRNIKLMAPMSELAKARLELEEARRQIKTLQNSGSA